jgi:hypothetical protein
MKKKEELTNKELSAVIEIIYIQKKYFQPWLTFDQEDFDNFCEEIDEVYEHYELKQNKDE